MKKLVPLLLCMLPFYSLLAQEISIELFKSDFNSPVNLQHAGDERLFVVEQGGLIKVIDADGSVLPTPFLNLSGQISTGNERGLLGLAFHPEYASNGFFYVNYIDTNGNTQVSRFSVSTSNENVADPNSELDIIDYIQPSGNHNGGCMAFGADGYLYISSGDGGGSGDTDNRAQNRLLLLGKLLRIDVDNPSDGNNYGIPADNPFIADPDGRNEIWAYGLRNPWKFSFDSETNDLWIGDVGQGAVEEIDRASATQAGLNYGWRCYEGNAPFNTANCPDDSTLTFPIAQYSSAGGSPHCSITGGYVYRGSAFPENYGLYFFADYCSGLIGTVDAEGNLTEQETFGGNNWVSFGEDVNKELYILSLGGTIYRVTSETLSTSEFTTEDFSLIPNPASDKVILNFKDERVRSISIFDLKGSLLFSEEAISTTNKEISLSGFSNGMYLVKITSEAGDTQVKKLLIQ